MADDEHIVVKNKDAILPGLNLHLLADESDQTLLLLCWILPEKAECLSALY
jgi:hypothetical protein